MSDQLPTTHEHTTPAHVPDLNTTHERIMADLSRAASEMQHYAYLARNSGIDTDTDEFCEGYNDLEDVITGFRSLHRQVLATIRATP